MYAPAEEREEYRAHVQLPGRSERKQGGGSALARATLQRTQPDKGTHRVKLAHLVCLKTAEGAVVSGKSTRKGGCAPAYSDTCRSAPSARSGASRSAGCSTAAAGRKRTYELRLAVDEDRAAVRAPAHHLRGPGDREDGAGGQRQRASRLGGRSLAAEHAQGLAKTGRTLWIEGSSLRACRARASVLRGGSGETSEREVGLTARRT